MPRSPDAISRRRCFEACPALTVLAALLVGVYYPVLLRCYAMADDYPYLWVFTADQPQYFHWLSAMGRPLYEVLSVMLYSAAGTICNLGYIRALTLLGTVLFAGQLYRACRRHHWPSLQALCIAMLICTSSAFGIYLSWSVCFNAVYAACITFWAGEVAAHGIAKPRCGYGDQSLAVVLLIVGLMLYQPTAMAYWLYVAVAVFAPGGWRPSTGVLARLLAVFMLALAVYWVFYRLGLHWLLAIDSTLQGPAGRSQLIEDFGEKLDFLLQSLLLAASIGHFKIMKLIALVVLGVAVAGLWTRLRQERDWRLPGLWIGLLPLSYLPAMIVAQNALVGRLLGVLSALLVVYLCFGVHALLNGGDRLRNAMITGVFLLLAGYSAFAVHGNVDRYLIELHRWERQYVVAALRRHYGPDAEAVAIVRPAHANIMAGVPTSIEYGMPDSGLSAAYARVMVQQLFVETFATRHIPTVHQCAEPERLDCPEIRQHRNLPVIDLAEALLQTPGDPRHADRWRR